MPFIIWRYPLFDVDFKADIDVAKLAKKYEGRVAEAQAFLDDEVIRGSDPFVPFQQGTLARTVVREEPGKIVYVQPYARRQYYGDSFDFTLTHHPLAGSRWTERAKAAHMKDWQAGVERILKGGNGA
jgi:hypothetical protein